MKIIVIDEFFAAHGALVMIFDFVFLKVRSRVVIEIAAVANIVMARVGLVSTASFARNEQPLASVTPFSRMDGSIPAMG